MKNNIIINLGLAVATMGFVACSNAPHDDTTMEKQVDRTLAEFTAARDEALAGMRDLREKLSTRLVEVDARLMEPELTAEERGEWESHKAEINEQIQRLDDNLGEVEASTNETWNAVKEGTRNTVKDIGDWIERQAEKIDRKTDADHDKDGQ